MSIATVRDWRGVPASQIGHRLWQCGFPRFQGLVERGIGIVALAAHDAQPTKEDVEHIKRSQPGLSLILCPFDDTEDDSALPGIVQKADAVAKRLVQRLGEGKTALVTCAVGRNRSGLISALALRYMLGITGAEAADRVRDARRPDLPHGEEALSNRTFLRYLRALPAVAR